MTQFNVQAPFLHDLVSLHGKWHPNKTALVDHKTTRNWKQVDDHSNQIANGLIALGLKKGDCVSILMTNCVEYVEIMYGIWKAGGVVTPLNLTVSTDGIIGMNNDADVKIALYTAKAYSRLQPHLSDMPSINHHIVFDDDAFENTTHYKTWLETQPVQRPNVDIKDHDISNIIYSSGTTGRPKGIKHTFRSRIQALYEMALMQRYHYGAVSICSIGLYSSIAWAPILLSLIVAGPCIIQKDFIPAHWLELVEKHKVTHTSMAPILFQRILECDSFTPKAVKSLETVTSGGSPLFEELKKEVSDQFQCNIIEIYGLTEGFITSLQPEVSHGRLASVGKPIHGNDYILLDQDDRELPWGEKSVTGEICIYGVHMMVEYHNRPEATKDAMFIDQNGKNWLRTGDIGTTDKHGFLYITDRKKDMILSGGQNIYPQDIEAIMINHPDISEVAVIGIPDPKWGETPIAIIVPNTQNVKSDDIKTWTNENVGKRQRIKQVIIRSDMPRNLNGKILKRQLRIELT